MTSSQGGRRRQWLPWILSAALLIYVFGWATDWTRLRVALEHADLPLFIAFATADRLAFFLVWTLLQAAALRRFVAHVPIASVLAIRGGSELLRAVSNPLSDAAFFLGLVQLCGGRVDGVIAAALVPAICHFLMMGLQMTLALLVLPGGLAGNRDVAIGAGVMWAIVIGVAPGGAHLGDARGPASRRALRARLARALLAARAAPVLPRASSRSRPSTC